MILNFLHVHFNSFSYISSSLFLAAWLAFCREKKPTRNIILCTKFFFYLYLYRIKKRTKWTVVLFQKPNFLLYIEHIITPEFYVSWNIRRSKCAKMLPFCWMFNVRMQKYTNFCLNFKISLILEYFKNESVSEWRSVNVYSGIEIQIYRIYEHTQSTPKGFPEGKILVADILSHNRLNAIEISRNYVIF